MTNLEAAFSVPEGLPLRGLHPNESSATKTPKTLFQKVWILKQAMSQWLAYAQLITVAVEPIPRDERPATDATEAADAIQARSDLGACDHCDVNSKRKPPRATTSEPLMM
jgi:hypothetical protein